MFKKRLSCLFLSSLLLIGCNQNNPQDNNVKNEHAAIMESCASDVRELNKGKSAPQYREICRNIDIVPGALLFPTVFCYFGSLLNKQNEFDVEKTVVEFSGNIDAFGGYSTFLINVKFSKGRFYVYTAVEQVKNEQSYYVYHLFDCHYNTSNNKMVNFVYFLGNEYGNPLIGAYEYKNNIYSCYYKRSEDDEALQDSYFLELIDEYNSLESEMNNLMNTKYVADETTSTKCINLFSDSLNYVY